MTIRTWRKNTKILHRRKYYCGSQTYFYNYFTLNVGLTYTSYQTNKENKGQVKNQEEKEQYKTDVWK